MLRLAIAHRSDILSLQATTLGLRSCQLASYPFHFFPKYPGRLAKYRFTSQAIITNTMPRTKKQAVMSRALGKNLTNPDKNQHVVDGPEALRASVDAEEADEQPAQEEEDQATPSLVAESMSDLSFSELSSMNSPTKTDHAMLARSMIRSGDAGINKEIAVPAEGLRYQPVKEPAYYNPEAEIDEEADEEGVQAALSRLPPVDSDYLPLPWKGRLGYACLCTYLRYSNPPVFSSRTCRIASIIENRHPLRDPNEPAHTTKNRPDRDQPPSIERGQAFVQELGLANARDIVKMLRWNDRYGIKFLRLSSEMFPFASHEEYGYKLAPFASGVLAEAGKLAAKLGHRLTTHPGQFTQLGSPRNEVIVNAIRDLEYHAELLSLLKLPPQQNRDAVMILHLGGVFGDKAATLDRFRANYKRLSPGIKKRLVLENDDVSWSVHDLLPVCEELDIPMVLDYHHHNIIFDANRIREGTKDIMDLYSRILATWTRKNITPKMHYSEPTPAAITGRQRRKHSNRVATLPPCPPTMDLMIEAKDKEQAVFELMRTFKLPGFNTFNNMIPHMRQDENRKKITKPAKKKSSKTKKIEEEGDNSYREQVAIPVAEEDVGMGGSEGRVYWPPGMEHWLRPAKRVVRASPKKTTLREQNTITTSAKKKRKAIKEEDEEGEEEADEQRHISPNDIATTRKPAKRARTALTSSSAIEKSTATTQKKEAQKSKSKK